MIDKYLLRPDRQRQVPPGFSWVDHRLIRHAHLSRCDHSAWALYLFLVTVGDVQGLSYYSDAAMGRHLKMDPLQLAAARKQLVAADLIAQRQALALMDHPNIAQVFDGGATEAGRPYFVMELVRGIPIIDYCDARKLSTVERLELFLPVCQAVQHAHQKGVIHRDLKPSNILVTEMDGQPVPKVIDFGVAKATQQPLTEKTLFTRLHQIVGTPAYMSPEQAGLGGLDIDTRSDIYSLGVLLYELLTGRTPFDIKKLLETGYDLPILARMASALSPHQRTKVCGCGMR